LLLFFQPELLGVERFVPHIDRIKNSTTVNKKKTKQTGQEQFFLCGFWKTLADPA